MAIPATTLQGGQSSEDEQKMNRRFLRLKCLKVEEILKNFK
jgi:hypothetical protein